MKSKQGLDDFLASGGTIEELNSLPAAEEESKDVRGSDPIGLLNLELARDGVELWHSPDCEGFATFPQDGGMRNVRVESEGFKTYLIGLYYRATGKAPRGSTIGDAIATYSAIARFDKNSKKYETGLRWAHHSIDDVPTLWIDLCDGKGSILRTSAMTLQNSVVAIIVKLQDSPIRFIQPTTMRTLPVPVFEGPVPDICDFINIDPQDADLVWGFMVGCFTPFGGLPFLMVTAQQGSGKSMSCKLIRSLIDPSIVPSRTVTGLDDVRSVVLTNAMFVLDNQSHISHEMSNLFCQLSTGGGYNKKKLYSDFEESLVSGKRPIIFNGLSDMSQKPDLLSRCISIELPILTGKIRPEQEIEARWEEVRPRVFGELVTRISRALRDLSTSDPKNLPRLADMARWVTASEPEMNKGDFLRAFGESTSVTNLRILEEDPVAIALIKLGSVESLSKITTTDLLEKLRNQVSVNGYPPRGFPDNAYKLGRKLKELFPVFQKAGWTMHKYRSSNERSYEIVSPERKNRSVETSQNDNCMTLQSDLYVTDLL